MVSVCYYLHVGACRLPALHVRLFLGIMCFTSWWARRRLVVDVGRAER